MRHMRMGHIRYMVSRFGKNGIGTWTSPCILLKMALIYVAGIFCQAFIIPCSPKIDFQEGMGVKYRDIR